MIDTLTHALTIHQPYAWAVAAGHKPVENRTWRPPLEAVGKLIGIHAGLTMDPVEGECWRSVPVPGPNTLVYGALIGVARLVGVIRADRYQPSWVFHRVQGRSSAIAETLSYERCQQIAPWWRGPWGWLLEEAVLLSEPIPMRGQQGLWKLPTMLDFNRGPPIAGGMAIIMDPRAVALEQWRKAREMR